MFRAVSRLVRLSFVTIVATTSLSDVAMTPVFAQATQLSKEDQRLLKAATASCKSEAKHKKVKLLKRRQYVVDCVEALKNRRELGHQDRRECVAEAEQQNIAKRDRAEFIGKCMGARQNARKKP